MIIRDGTSKEYKYVPPSYQGHYAVAEPFAENTCYTANPKDVHRL